VMIDDGPPVRAEERGVVAGDRRCPAALATYLTLVREELSRRGIEVVAVRIRAGRPQEALSARLELAPGGAGTGLVRVPVAAGWHEELGWWAEVGDRPGPARCYLNADVAAYPTQVADFLTGLARGEDLGSMHPALHRYRLLAGEQELVNRLVPSRAPSPAGGS
jgi:hypothetical protein